MTARAFSRSALPSSLSSLILRRERRLVVEVGAHLRGFVDVDHRDRFSFHRIAIDKFAPPQPCSMAASFQPISTASPMPVFMPKPPAGQFKWAASPARKTVGLADICRRPRSDRSMGARRAIRMECLSPRAKRSLFRRVEIIDLFLQDVADVQTPQLFAVDGGDGAVDLRVDDLILHRRAVSNHFQ